MQSVKVFCRDCTALFSDAHQTGSPDILGSSISCKLEPIYDYSAAALDQQHNCVVKQSGLQCWCCYIVNCVCEDVSAPFYEHTERTAVFRYQVTSSMFFA